MYLEPNNPSLSFANFLDAAIRDKAEIKPFRTPWRCADVVTVLTVRTENVLSSVVAV